MKERIVFLDYARVLACFMVITVHSCEFYFIDGAEIGIRSAYDAIWVCVIDSAFRCSVPLFVMISGWLLLPVIHDINTFYKKRMIRVLIPFIIWSLLYVLLPISWGDVLWQDIPAMLISLLTNFNNQSAHFWFIYMLVGLYLFMPVLSPWLQKASKCEMQRFLILWFASTFFPYLRLFCGDIYGECYWNEFNLLWYFSGFAGYILLAVYIREHIRWSFRNSLMIGLPCIIIGYSITAWIWYQNSFTATTLQSLETSWRFCTPNVAMLTFGVFILMRHCDFRNKISYKAIQKISVLSFGIYLMHILVLNASYPYFALLSTPFAILFTSITTFLVCIFIAYILNFLPFKKYLLG